SHSTPPGEPIPRVLAPPVEALPRSGRACFNARRSNLRPRERDMSAGTRRGRRVLITGGAGGMGLACASLMGAQGDSILLTDAGAPALDAAVAELARAGIAADAFVCDLADAGAGAVIADA